MDRSRGTTWLGIFLLSVSLITYEIGLTRLFSAIFYYHYVFLVISFSVLGLGLGGYLLHLTRKWEEGWLARVQHAYGLVYLLTLSGLYFLPFLKSPVVYMLIGTLPFLLGGYLLAYYFKQKQFKIGQLYFADLLGSTAGVGGILFLFHRLGVFPALLFMTGIAFVSTVFLVQSRKSRWVLTVSAVLLMALTFLPGLENWGNQAFRGFYTSPYSAMQGLVSEYTHWDGFARTDVYRSADDQKVILLDGSAAAPINRFDGDLSKVEHMKQWIGYLPFVLAGGEKGLVIGPGGGEDILHALLAGLEEITAVEINPGSVEAVHRLADFSGDIYQDPRVTTYIQDGRNFVEQNRELYDQIYLSVVMTNVADHGGKVLVENYIYTQEAIDEYLQDLKPGGYVTFVMHQQSDLLRLASTVIQLLKDKGATVEEIMNRLVIYYDPRIKHGDHEMMMYPVLMLRDSAISREEALLHQQQIYQAGYAVVTMPHLYENPLFRKLASGEYSYRAFEEQLGFNLRPVTDAHPFIYQASRGVPQYLKILLLVIGVSLSGAYLYGRTNFQGVPRVTQQLSYFVLLGFGFMMLEIVLMQKFAVYLGYPIVTFVAVLGSLLFSSGVGSYFSEKITQRVHPLGVVAGYGLLLNVVIPVVVAQTIHLGLAWKISWILGLLAPLGFFMGMGFPYGVQRLKDAGNEELVPLVWAMNGLASVGGSVLSITVALLSDFQVVSFVGIACYLGAYLLSRKSFFKGVINYEKMA